MPIFVMEGCWTAPMPEPPMPRPLLALPWLVCLISFLAGPASIPAAEEHAFFHENVMGTSLELRVLADDAESAARAEQRALAEIDRLSLVFSGYDPSSELSRWQSAAPGPVAASLELRELLAACDHWRTRSGGAFDARVEVLSRLWTRSARVSRAPSDSEISRALAVLSRPAWRVSPEAGTIERLSDCPITLNAIAKGFIVERACAAALVESQGVRGLLLNSGGDLRICGEFVRRLAIADPSADSESSPPLTTIEVRERAVATSGGSQRGFQVGGRRFSHIIDPRTGRPANRVASATVIARHSADADALATICNVLEPEESLRLVASLEGAECLIVTREGRVVRSPGWSRHERAATTTVALAAAPAPAVPKGETAGEMPWGRDFELAIDFQLNAPQEAGQRYRRPYVAIWVERKDGFPVRNLALWVSMGGAGPFQWIPDLKRWYRADQLRKQTDKKEMLFTIARPTRPPGKYRVIWDGKNDKGEYVPPGEYTILIDAAREHGTYQNIRKQVTLNGQPFSEQIPGDIEIRSATIEFRKRAAARARQ